MSNKELRGKTQSMFDEAIRGVNEFIGKLRRFIGEFTKKERATCSEEEIFSILARDASRTAKRFFSMIISNGLLRSLVFALNKTTVWTLEKSEKNEVPNGFNKAFKNIVEKKTLSDSDKWLIVLWYVLDYPLKEFLPSDINTFAEELLNKLLRLKEPGEAKYALLEHKILIHLDILSKILAAYERAE